MSLLLTLPENADADIIANMSLCDDTTQVVREDKLPRNLLTPNERASLLWYLEEYWQWPYEGFAQRGAEVEKLLVGIGQRLFHTVFCDLDHTNLRHINIESAVPAALSLPWELLHDGNHFLALRAPQPVSIVRRLSADQTVVKMKPFQSPLRILLITSRPNNMSFVDQRVIAHELVDELQDATTAGIVDLEFLRPPTITALQDRLLHEPPIHVLHFDGHGTFVPADEDEAKSNRGRGNLIFEMDNGEPDSVDVAQQLVLILRQSTVQLAVLTACQSAFNAEDNAFSSIAAQLIQGGVDAVVAMSASVLVTTAVRYARTFYHEFASGSPILLAHEHAQQVLSDNPQRHPHQRHGDQVGQAVLLCDWWLPQFYLQRELTLLATGSPFPPRVSATSSSVFRLSDTMPAAPRYGYIGRARELLQIERQLRRRRLVVIHGFAGTGKTALAREAADWLTRTEMYVTACFVSFERVGDAATWLLSEVGRHLGAYDGGYDPGDVRAALATLRPVLKQYPTLIIADNLESVLPGVEAPLPSEARRKLWSTLLALRDAGAGVILTTQNTDFDDKQLALGGQIWYLSLDALHPDDAYALANRLLDELQIDHVQAPYHEVRALLTKLDNQPLAIQLVLPVLREMPIRQLSANFDRLLPYFTDDTETGRNRSLLVSLDYSLRRLSEAQRVLLRRLAIFEGGAEKQNLLAITEISEVEWAELCRVLEQTALLRTVAIKDWAAPFLQFHPVLAPYLRSQELPEELPLGAGVGVSLHKGRIWRNFVPPYTSFQTVSLAGGYALNFHRRYADHYRTFARAMVREEQYNPKVMRARVKHELPNMHRALDMLLSAGDLDAAMEMMDYIARFLNIFSLHREHDELRQRTEVALKARPTIPTVILTLMEHRHECSLGEAEVHRNDLPAARTRFESLLARIEALPEGSPLSRRSYEHCEALIWVARCLRISGQPAAAEEHICAALAIVEALIEQKPEDRDFILQQVLVLSELASVEIAQAKYLEARRTLEKTLLIEQRDGNRRGEAVTHTQLGYLALLEEDYAAAHRFYTKALVTFRDFDEPYGEAIILHQLGVIAQRQHQMAQAERYARKSLALNENRGENVRTAANYLHIGIITAFAGRPSEAERWYRRTLDLLPESGNQIDRARCLNNLAELLLTEVRAGRAEPIRLAEARDFGEQALAIQESLDLATAPWKILHILAMIADLEGQTEAARRYRYRERETFAAYEANWRYVDQQHGKLIQNIARACNDWAARMLVEAELLKLEEAGWKIANSIRRIWRGEREWYTLVEELDGKAALLVKRVLEILTDAPTLLLNDRTTEWDLSQVRAIAENQQRSLAMLREIDQRSKQRMELGSRLLRERKTQEAIMNQAISKLRDLAVSAPTEGKIDISAVLNRPSVILAITTVAQGDLRPQAAVKALLLKLEERGWHLSNVVYRIWSGERHEESLVEGLKDQEAVLVLRVLEELERNTD